MSPLKIIGGVIQNVAEGVEGVELKARNRIPPEAERQTLDTYMTSLGYSAADRAKVVTDDKLRREVASALILVQRVAPKAGP